MYALLFFLPIYYRVIKDHSQIATGALLLPQTLAIAPCACLVFIFVELVGVSYRWAVALGWACTACGIAMLTMLSVDRSISADISLNLLSGFGIGILLPALALNVKDSVDDTDTLQALMLLVFMRYLGSASGLIVTGVIFQHALQHNLALTKFHARANEMTQHATTLMHSIHEMSESEDKRVLIQATEDSLHLVWIILSAVSFVVFVLSCFTVLPKVTQKRTIPQASLPLSSEDTPPRLELDWSQLSKL
jgi:hypothetical protein